MAQENFNDSCVSIHQAKDRNLPTAPLFKVEQIVESETTYIKVSVNF